MIDEFNKMVELGEDKELGRTVFGNQIDSTHHQDFRPFTIQWVE